MKTTLLTVCLLASAAFAAHNPPRSGRTPRPTVGQDSITITGRLVRPDGTPAGSERVHVARVRGTRMQIDLDAGTVNNPSAMTGSDGRFTIRVPESYLPLNQEFTLFVSVLSRLEQDGAAVVFSFIEPPRRARFDVGTVVLK